MTANLDANLNNNGLTAGAGANVTGVAGVGANAGLTNNGLAVDLAVNTPIAGSLTAPVTGGSGNLLDVNLAGINVNAGANSGGLTASVTTPGVGGAGSSPLSPVLGVVEPIVGPVLGAVGGSSTGGGASPLAPVTSILQPVASTVTGATGGGSGGGLLGGVLGLR